MAIASPAPPVNRKKPSAPVEFRVVLTGNQRLTENFILEVRAIAQRCGLEIPSVQVIRQPKVGPKTIKKNVRSCRKTGV